MLFHKDRKTGDWDAVGWLVEYFSVKELSENVEFMQKTA